MKKTVKAFCLSLLLFFVLSVPAFADNNVTEMDVQVLINDDGSAEIVQVWQGEFSEGTENYIPISKSGYLKLSNFSVKDKNGEFSFLKDWDVKASREEKAGKCGVVETSDGYEICWGIGEYGSNTYTVKYHLDNVVGSYKESDGVNFRFINDEMSVFPSNARVTISAANGKAITDENSNIWAFGFNGEIVFDDGKIYASTDTPLKSKNHITIMFEFEKGFINPVRVVNESFEKVKDTAFKDSDYEENDAEKILVIVIFALVGACLLWAIIANIIIHSKFKKFEKETEYFRDVPNGGRLNVSYKLSLTSAYCEDGAIIGATILKLINSGNIVPIDEEKVNFFGNTSQEINLQLVSPPTGDTGYFEGMLYSILEMASGEDKILQEKELKKFFSKDPTKLRKFINAAIADGENALYSQGCYLKLASGKRVKNLKGFTDTGKKELAEVVGLRKFLEEFSLIDERGIEETNAWRDYLLYALLFGIADKVKEQMKKVYPQITEEIEVYYRHVYIAGYYNHFIYSSLKGAEAARTAGSGGSSSFGGGGGFSGGGSGGGSR